MHTGRLIFSQVMDYLPMHTFRQCVNRYQGNRKTKKFSCLDQFLCMAFAQLTYRESLRDIEVCLRAQHKKLYHMGIRGGIARNTLANANKSRDWRIYADLAQSLITIARDLYINEDFGLDLDNTVYALDASTIDLCLFRISVGFFSSNESSSQIAHATGSTGKYSNFHPYFRWQTTRRQRSRYPYSRTRSFLYNGSRLCRL